MEQQQHSNENNIKFGEIKNNLDNSSEKCGEILITKNHNCLQFCCIFCKYIHADLKLFFHHILSYHFEETTFTELNEPKNNSFNINEFNKSNLEYEAKESNIDCSTIEIDKLYEFPSDNLQDDCQKRNLKESEDVTSSICDSELEISPSLEIETLQCKICKKLFDNAIKFKRHKCRKCTKSKFKDEKKFICEYCSLMYCTKENLKSHVKSVHLKEFPYKCDYCDKRYVHNHQKLRHEKTHLGLDKTYECNICGNKYQTSTLLKVHKQRHTNDRQYECVTCKKRFFTKVQLKNHVAIHTDLRPFACELCSAAWKTIKALKNHQKIHSDKKYDCTICNKTFSQPAGLYIHKKTHHPDK